MNFFIEAGIKRRREECFIWLHDIFFRINQSWCFPSKNLPCTLCISFLGQYLVFHSFCSVTLVSVCFSTWYSSCVHLLDLSSSLSKALLLIRASVTLDWSLSLMISLQLDDFCRDPISTGGYIWDAENSVVLYFREMQFKLHLYSEDATPSEYKY